ncbi:uncharacterized protein LOC111606212 isoform X1 [Xiphophorus maculatus]|uniref:uncharacterized protein LOC111606212 isoform X1 n=1 Tax=Xiphophorus maculatus TaxID=8083 RepID=UPI000C6D441F|nr:uncharacterized protein LOC111606212 isoform X1 [Xiphophorus maculatus]
MDVSALRQQYRMCRDKQRTEFHLLRTGEGTVSPGSSDLLGVVSIVPVAQGWTSSWQPARPSPPDPKTSDPWRVHLDLHRRCPAVAMETERSHSRSRTASSWFWFRPDPPLIWTSALHPQIILTGPAHRHTHGWFWFRPFQRRLHQTLRQPEPEPEPGPEPEPEPEPEPKRWIRGLSELLPIPQQENPEDL